MQFLARSLLKLLGWTLIEAPDRPARAVLIAYPHTSNWDGFYALLIKWALRLDTHWVGKDALFRPPFGGLLRWLGGVPVNRRQRTGFVEQMVGEFARRQNFMLVMAPEGTRSLTGGWKSGFYRIARATDMPVTLGYVDRTTMTTGLGPTIELTGDVAADMDVIRAFYADKAGLRPERRTEPRLQNEAAEAA